TEIELPKRAVAAEVLGDAAEDPSGRPAAPPPMTWRRGPAAPRADQISRDPTGCQASRRARAAQRLESAPVIEPAPTTTAAASPALVGPTTRERRNALIALTLLHTINDFYGLLLPPLLPALRATFD